MAGAASMWPEMSHKSCFISSAALAEKDELLFFPSHSHVYLSVICALEQRLLMPCLWYMTHHTEQLFILWINSVREGEWRSGRGKMEGKKMQTWPGGKGVVLSHSYFEPRLLSSHMIRPIFLPSCWIRKAPPLPSAPLRCWEEPWEAECIMGSPVRWQIVYLTSARLCIL